jgi:serine/threonine-protein kinase
MSPEQARGESIDRRSDIFSVGSMLYRMMTDRLPFEANNDLESLLRVQKAEFPPPEEAKPGLGASVAAIIRRAMRLHPAERYQTAEEMLVEVERVLRTEFHSAGQTELKSWLVQLGRRDNAPSIGRAPRDETGVVKDIVGTDLSIGTSFELRDLDLSSEQTELQRGRTPSPEPKPFPGGSLKEPPPLPRSGHTAEIAKPGANPPARGRSGGFWFGVILTLGAVVGARYLWVWAENKGVMTALGIGGNGGNATTPNPVPVPAPAPSVASTEATGHAPAPAPSNAAQPAQPAQPAAGPSPATAAKTSIDAASAAAPAIAAGSPDAHPPVAEAPPAEQKPSSAAPPAEKAGEGADTDEEALLRKAVPNAEDAVIGEDEAEAETTTAAKSKPAAKPHATPGKPAPEVPRVETAILHFTSVPTGAVVKTKARVLGRTPIALHFKTGNTYEIVLVKRGYEPATRKVAVHNTKDRKLAVTLKKTPPPRHTFFHPHR